MQCVRVGPRGERGASESGGGGEVRPAMKTLSVPQGLPQPLSGPAFVFVFCLLPHFLV